MLLYKFYKKEHIYPPKIYPLHNFNKFAQVVKRTYVSIYFVFYYKFFSVCVEGLRNYEKNICEKTFEYIYLCELCELCD